MSGRSDVGVKSVQVALDVLEAVAFADREMGVTELATKLKLTKGTIFRHLKTLVERGYLSQNAATSRYRLGVKSHLLGLMATASIDLLSASEQAMNELREAAGQTVVLSAVETRAIRVITTVMGKSAIEIGVRAGSELQFHASAQGKIGLAFSRRPPIARLQRQTLTRFTEHTVTSWDALRRELERVRTQGWATAPEQAMLGINALAAPILDETGDCVGSLAIVGSIQFIRREPDATQIAAVKQAAQNVSRNLGYHDASRNRAVA
jgi:IclR family transcriptional regulator, KDG regulon repressor